MTVGAVIKAIESYANPALQESWDNTGLQVGSMKTECTGVLFALDPTPETVDEASSLGCNLIVTHHPLFFKPVKKLTGSTPQQVTAMNAIAAGISIYSTHTASDSAKGGVSYELARRLGLKPLRVLSPLKNRMISLRVIVPDTHVEQVMAALFDAGAGALGDYDCCSFNIKGQGTFRPLGGATPYVGEIGMNHTEAETEVCVVLHPEDLSRVEQAMLEAHPYETPAYSFLPMMNISHDVGLGVYGVYDGDGLSQAEFIERIKSSLGCKALRTNKTTVGQDAKIRRVAVCGGAGGEFIPVAASAGAQAYVTADVRYHDFVDWRNDILVVDAGHYETEVPVLQCLAESVAKVLPNLPLHITTLQDNPINYI